MSALRNTSIRRKQMFVIMLTSSVSLLLACSAFVAYDTITFRGKLVESVSVLADVIGSNCAAALDFNDPKTAGETLSALRANPNIVSACVYTPDGQVFAVYARGPESAFVPPPMQAMAQRFTVDQLHLFRLIQQRNALTGTIFVASDLTDLTSRLLRYTGIVIAVFVASLLVALALSSRLQRVFSDPILQLARVARLVAVEKNYAVRAIKHDHDELGQLVDGFNEMLAQIQARDIALQVAREDRDKRVAERAAELAKINQELVKSSRYAGMAEVATGVLHNVGNVLNSVNVSATLVSDQVHRSKSGNVGKLATLFAQNKANLGDFLTKDERGRMIPDYLGTLADELAAENQTTTTELDHLRKNVEHIKDIVAMQQSYARTSGAYETHSVPDLVEEALRMNAGSLERHDVQTARDYRARPVVTTDKHKVMQILINLVRNAKYACDESGSTDKKILVRITADEQSVKIAVIDNGVGIQAENLTRIFNYGFTTRKTGHGFGLHSCALAAKELGGTLQMESEGPGKGATFVLTLAYAPKGVVS